MASRTSVLWALAATLLAAGAAVAAPDKALNFRLNDQNGSSHELYRLEDAPAVILFAFVPGCPVGRATAAGLAALKNSMGEQAPPVLGINAVAGDDRAAVSQALGEVSVPVLMDRTLTISRALGFRNSGEVLIVLPKDAWKIAWRGALDAAALEAYLKGQPMPASETHSEGQEITFPDYSTLSYAKDIAPILESKCMGCHREGGVGPFAMSDYRKVHGWADMIDETVRMKRMPPWHADPAVSAFQNSRELTAGEEGKLLAWVAAGAPQDGSEDPLPAAAASKIRQKWQLGEPDKIVQLPEAEQLPAEGIINYRYIPVPVNIDEDKWVRAVEVRTDNPAVVHHALIFIKYPREYRYLQPRSEKGLRGYFAAYLPGALLQMLPEDAGIFVPKGSVFIFQMHYNSTGKPEQEQCELGLYFHDAPPARSVRIEAGHENDFVIPPNAADAPTHCTYDFKQDAEILGLSPHMHYRGSRFKFTAEYPDGEKQVLLNVPWYEFDWQPMYVLKDPVPVPAGTHIACDGAFDNSRFNKKNPDPGKLVRFGEQSFQEMFIGYVQYAVPRDPDAYKPKELSPEEAIGMGVPITAENLPGMKFRLIEKLKVEFMPDGTMHTLDGYPMGHYHWDGPNVITTRSLFGEIRLRVVGDEMYIEGDLARRLG